MTAIPGSFDLSAISLAISKDGSKAVISGHSRVTGVAGCGIFELATATGEVRKVPLAEDPGCAYEDSWRELSLSPDAGKAVAERHGEIGLIDLRQGKLKCLGPGWSSAWSPDGKWIAISDYSSGSNITLLDSGDFSVRRKFRGAHRPELMWSPDSRYLLVSKLCLWNPESSETLETLDPQNGSRRVIRSSFCAVEKNTVGWVSHDVIR